MKTKSIMKKYFLLFISIAGTLNASLAQTVPHLIKNFSIKGNGSWDYLAVQPSSNKLFVSHGTEVNIVNKETGDSIGCIKGLDGVHGIAFVPELNKGYISNGHVNNIIVFDLTKNTVITQIKVGENPDAIFYEPTIKRIIVCNGKSKDISIIDPATDKVVKTIAMDARPEVAVSDGKKLYVNLEDKSQIAQIDFTDFTIKQIWQLKPDAGPTGMAIDVKNNLLFSASAETKHLLVIDAINGKIIQRLPIGEDCDGVGFDKDKKMIYASNRGGTLTVIQQKSKTDYAVVKNITTRYGAKTITVDKDTHKIYLPGAEMKKGSDEEKPKIVQNTFSVFVFGY